MSFEKLNARLQAKVQATYESGITLDDAEKLAAEFLYAQFQVSDQLKVADLDSRMRKTGVKAVRAAIYMEAATKSDKKPSDSFLENLVNLNELVQSEQEAFDLAEVERAHLERSKDIFSEGHILYRGIAKGKFE